MLISDAMHDVAMVCFDTDAAVDSKNTATATVALITIAPSRLLEQRKQW
jgi:hypothetical protein